MAEGTETTDMTDLVARLSRQKQAIEAAFPEPDELPKRMPLIARLRGRAPTLAILLKAGVQLEAMDAIAENRHFDWNRAVEHPLIQHYIRYTPSLARKQGGGGRDELVEMVYGQRPSRKPWWKWGKE